MAMWHIKLKGMNSSPGYTEKFYSTIKLVTLGWGQRVNYHYCRDENSQPFSIRKTCRLTPKRRKAIFKSLYKGLKSQNINRNQSVYAKFISKIELNFIQK